MKTDRFAPDHTPGVNGTANWSTDHSMTPSEGTPTQKETSKVDPALKTPMYGLLLWIAGCILWNVAGVMLVSHGATGIGPTASLPVAAVLGLAALLLIYAARHSLILFAALSALFALGGLVAVYQAVTGDPSLWPSPFWRWAGAALNMLGLVAGAMGTARGLLSR